MVSLSVGSNIIAVEVTAEDDSTSRTYTVTVTRAEPLSTDTTLSGLTLSGIDFGTFASTTTSYTAHVASGVGQTTITPAVNHSGASYVIKLGGASDVDGVVELDVGTNVITIEVTAEDGRTTQAYTVTVIRAELLDRENLLDRYDLNDDGIIQRDEVVDAIMDYFDSVIAREEVIEVIKLYFSAST